MTVNPTAHGTDHGPSGKDPIANLGSVTLVGTAAGGHDTTDSTSRMTVQSYQTNGTHFFGEGIRMDLMRPTAKNMIAWRLPRDAGFDDPATLRSVTWIGAHYYAQDQVDLDNPTNIHGHWSVEVPDASDALRTRFEVKFIKSDGTIGVDKTLVQTASADMVVDCSNEQRMRLRTGAGANKFIEFGNEEWGTEPRWVLGSPGKAEAGSNVGSDFALGRYNDSEVLQGYPITVERSTGRVFLGGSSLVTGQTDGAQSGLTVNRNSAGSAVTVNTNLAGATGAIAYNHNALDATSRTIQTNITSDSNFRLVVFADGKCEWGAGAATRDTNLYRAGVSSVALLGVLATDSIFRFKPIATASRPTAASAGAGGMYYDTTLSKPVWSDGTIWRDAVGIAA